jgi:putative ABC transport system permease protein
MAQLFSQLLFIHKQALKDLKRSLRKKITIFITIFISVFILFFISILNQSLLKEIKSNTKTILGGDAEIELNNKELNSDITNKIKKFADLSLNTTIASMVANKNLNPPQTSFVQLRAIDNLYPLYGEFITTKGKVGADFFESADQAIVNENLAVNLQLKEGDRFIIRDQNFILHSVIQQMPDLGASGLFGDLVIISPQGLASLQILSSENFFLHISEYLLPLGKLFSSTLHTIILGFTDKRPDFLINSISNFFFISSIFFPLFIKF